LLPSRVLVKAIFVPSGDQLAWSSMNTLFESLVGLVPSAFIT
jgi:hypothetical protein